MSLARESKQEFRFTGWHMLAIMVAFFGVIIAVNLTMALKASSTWTGLIVKNTYVESQKYNDHLADARRQAETGTRSTVTYAQGVLTIVLSAKSGAAVVPDDLVVSLGRPAFERMDRTLPANCGQEGSCTVRAELQPGHWLLRIEGTVAGHPYRRDARLRLATSGRSVVE